MSIKRIFFVGISFFSFWSLIGKAELYPEKISDFTPPDFSGFEDIYSKIYTDAHQENTQEIINRTLSHPLEVYNPIFRDETMPDGGSLKDDDFRDMIVSFCSRSPSLLSQTLRFSLSTQIKLSEYVQYLCLEERKLLRFENNLARRNTFRTLFANDFDGDSPFDLIYDLNDIDDIFYGEKFEEQKPPKPSFVDYEDASQYRLDPEFWQNQNAEGITDELGNVLAQKQYQSFPDSIVGNLAGMDPALKILGGSSLVGGISTNQMYEFPQHQGTSGVATGADPHQTKSASPDKSEPEVFSVARVRLFDFFGGLISRVLEESLAPELTNKGVKQNINTAQKNITEKEQTRFQNFIAELRAKEEQSEYRANDEYFGVGGVSRIDQMLHRWNQDLEAFLGTAPPPYIYPYSGAKGIHSIFKNLLIPKPQM